MSKEKVLDILVMNGIDESLFYQKMHRTLLLGVFEAICKDIKKKNAKAIEKEKFRKHSDKIVATKNIVKRYVGCYLSDEDYEELKTLLIAYFRAGEPRKKYDADFRECLIHKQGGRCAICQTDISSRTSHLDHIVPWDYVGDVLDENYQMLCETCNERKGTAAYFEISMLLLNKSL